MQKYKKLHVAYHKHALTHLAAKTNFLGWSFSLFVYTRDCKNSMLLPQFVSMKDLIFIEFFTTFVVQSYCT